MCNFDLSISVPDKIKTDGIYGIVRHPSYVGSILMFIGLSIISIKIALIYFVFVFYLSRAIEEEMILRNISSYRDYVNKVGMFFPRIRRVI
jgi:protein-S-isoprenylcysteine O-methyltransferase Ste14